MATSSFLEQLSSAGAGYQFAVLASGAFFSFGVGYLTMAIASRKTWRDAVEREGVRGMAKGYALAIDHRKQGLIIAPYKPSLRLVKLAEVQDEDAP